jgi:uncharacterized lipoprotein YajG
MKNLGLILLGILVITACGTKKKAIENKDTSAAKTEISTMEIIKIKATTGQFAKSSDPIIAIDTITVVDNTLFVQLRYGGGCEEHTFEAIGSLAIAKSYPPIRSVQLVHHANNDRCRAIVQKTLEIDVKDIAYQQKDGSEIYFTFENYPHRVYYKYVETAK